MFKNYLKIALRNLWKNKAFSAINIIGLATGLSVCLLIVLYVSDELSYDRYNKNSERIYRLDADLFFNGTQFTAATSPKPLATTLLKTSPQVEQMVRLSYRPDILVRRGKENIQDHHSVFADSTFFKVFTASMIAGDMSTALNEPNSVVIDETTARKYFNSTDVIGNTLYLDNAVSCKVTGVIKDFPRQSHFHFSFIRPLRDTYNGDENNWLSNNDQSYILVKEGVRKEIVQGDVDQAVKIYLSKQLEEVFHTSSGELESKGNHFRYHLMPLTDIHLHSDKSYEIEANGNINYVYIFSMIAIFILLIACVNFMNLSTARSANRAKEVGIRKVAGSSRANLITQFLTESVLLSFFSLLVAILLSTLLLPWFNQLADKQMVMNTLFVSWLLPVLIALVLVVGFIAGSYPAFYLSSFEPIQVLKGKVSAGFKSNWLRSSLVVFQFCISIILIVGVIVIYSQLDFIRSRKIGFDREQVLVLHNTYNMGEQIKTFKEELSTLPGIENSTITSNLPTSGIFSQPAWFRDATMDAQRAIIFSNFRVDEDYIPTLNMEMVKGRNFSRAFKSDSTGIILNEAAVRSLGLKEPLNTFLYRSDGNNTPMAVAYHVVGIVKDFNFSSMREHVAPLVMQLGEDWGNMAVRLQSKNIPSLIQQMETKWNSMAPGQPFSFTFMDNDFNNIYYAEQRTGMLFITFAIFAIFIACLGLFGLVTYAAEQRTKEIGIRKVLGAKVGGIVAMLSLDFLKLVVIAALISYPVAWWGMNKWLQSFAYRIDISWWVFAVAGLMTITIALITVSVEAIKAAIANPIKSLRTE